MEITSTDVKFICPDATEMIAYLSRPKDSARHPGIMVIHEAWGLNDQIKGVVRRYAENGFVAVAPNLFTRHKDVMTESNVEKTMKFMFRVPPEKRNDPEAIQGVMKSMSETERKVVEVFFLGRETLEKIMCGDLMGCKDFLQSQSFVRRDRLGITGFCMGGGLAYQVSTMYPFGATVPFYGANPKPIDSVASISGPVLGIYAGEDERINLAVPELVGSMIRHKKSFEMKLYKGVQHAFFNETRAVYDRAAAEDAWRITISFFKEHLLS
ncbi:MAG: dienelactone hydrolase family protein [Nitrososphaerales archaeon]|jgi:carboxymethylenebutenolidase